ncbi:MAG: glucose-1-phosphate thymidylyltransferase [Crocinitomicaceae bacterium]|nr:glucose-1-phosphate thymidylyltransferase [Crocinitomicaceae bacterium]
MKIVLVDNGLHLRFAPLSLTRPIGDLRIGIMTNTERWKLVEPTAEIFYETEAYLNSKYPSTSAADLVVNGALIPNDEVVAAILALSENEKLVFESYELAFKGTGSELVKYTGKTPLLLENRWDIFQKNELAIQSDFDLISAGRTSQSISNSNTVIGNASLIFVEEGAMVEAATLNTTTGPIYIGKSAEIMEGSIVRGPLAMCEYSTLKLGAKVYGATTLGPHCKVGGEVSNVVFQAYSNKGHDGFLGNATIGEWCNIGADTNASNLKNNYGTIAVYSYETQQEEQTDLQFIGLCMGDHSKCGINSMFNTGTVVGVSSNVFGSGFPAKYIPSFSWCDVDAVVPFRFDKAIEYANNMMQRRKLSLSTAEIEILKHIQSSN